MRASSRRGALASRPLSITVAFLTGSKSLARQSKHGCAAAAAAAPLRFNRGGPAVASSAAVAPLRGRHARESRRRRRRRCCVCGERHDAWRWGEQLPPQLHHPPQEGFPGPVVQLRQCEEALRDLTVDPAGAADEARWVWRDQNGWGENPFHRLLCGFVEG